MDRRRGRGALPRAGGPTSRHVALRDAGGSSRLDLSEKGNWIRRSLKPAEDRAERERLSSANRPPRGHAGRWVLGGRPQPAGGRDRHRARSHVSRIKPAASETAARLRPRRRVPAPSSRRTWPSRRSATARPTSSAGASGGSKRGAPSPLVSMRQPWRVRHQPTKRWTTGPVLCTRTTMSPTRTSDAVAATTRTRSPSRSQGCMLIPRTGNSAARPSAAKSQSSGPRRSGRNSSVAVMREVTRATSGRTAPGV